MASFESVLCFSKFSTENIYLIFNQKKMFLERNKGKEKRKKEHNTHWTHRVLQVYSDITDLRGAGTFQFGCFFFQFRIRAFGR